jgi:hypothetical protein
METKHQVHNLIILDESGSMMSIKETIISGFNEIVQTIKGIEQQFPEQEHFISLISFNGLGQKVIHFMDPTSKLEQINDSLYRPDASTPLYDAMGTGINKLKLALEGNDKHNVLVTVLTDGEENASKEFTGAAIKALIETLKKQRWTFTYIGADHDVERMAASLSITNTMRFTKNKEDMERMFNQEKMSRSTYSKKISNNEDTEEDFYKNP